MGEDSVKVQRKKLTDYRPNPRNHNTGTERGSEMIERSFKKYGAGRSLVADKHGVLIAGNQSQEGALEAGIENVIEIETTGDTVVVVKRVDLDLERDVKAAELGYIDNRANQVSLHYDVAQIVADVERGVDLSEMFSPSELGDLLGKVEVPELDGTPQEVQEAFMVLVTCATEAEQKRVLERLTKEGLTCKALIS